MMMLPPSDRDDELAALQAELELKDQLVERLSQEVLELARARVQQAEENASPSSQWRSRLESLSEQIAFYQEQIAIRDAQIERLRAREGKLSDRNRALEQIVRDLPQAYRQKYALRLRPIKAKLEKLSQENQQLSAQLQTGLAISIPDDSSGEAPDRPSQA